jgi:respiratory nitrate reductase gamma subunit
MRHVGIFVEAGNDFRRSCEGRSGIAAIGWSAIRAVRAGWAKVHHDRLAILVGGGGAILALTGGAMLLHRRLTDPRILATSSNADIGILALLLLQLVLGVLTIFISLQHLDGGELVRFMTWSQGIFTFRTDAWVARRDGVR